MFITFWTLIKSLDCGNPLMRIEGDKNIIPLFLETYSKLN